jgi:hypothetical protein
MKASTSITLGALLCSVSVANGAVIVTTLSEPLVIEDQFFGRSDPIDIDDDGVIDFTFRSNLSFFGIRTERANRVVIIPSPPPNIGGPVAPLDEGLSVGSILGESNVQWRSADLSDGFVEPDALQSVAITICFGACEGAFQGQRGYVGLEFELDDGIHYGYMDLQVFSAPAPGGRLYGWAWETQPGVPILTGAIPEPSTSVCFLLGGMVWAGLRSRKSNSTIG